jgi:hypothetical protein
MSSAAAVEAYEKTIDRGDGIITTLMLWDIAGACPSLLGPLVLSDGTRRTRCTGQDRFQPLMRAFFRGAELSFVVFDVSSRATFENTRTWKSLIDEKVCLGDGTPLPCFLVGNKIDLPRQVSADDARAFCASAGFVGYYETSAKDNIGVDELIGAAANHLLSADAAPLQQFVPATSPPPSGTCCGGDSGAASRPTAASGSAAGGLSVHR